MTHLHWLQRIIPRKRFLIAGIFSSLLLAAPSVLANSHGGYRPRNPSRPPTTTSGSTGTRGGCTGAAATTLTALAPENFVGETVSERPTFAWYVPDGPSRPIEFYLYEVGANQSPVLLHRAELASTPHLMTYTLPQTQAALIPGKEYVWQVRLLCNPAFPSRSLEAKATIKRVPMPAGMSGITGSDRLQQATRLAQAGIWYDALALALENRTSDYWLQLLSDLIQFEPPASPEQGVGQRDRLQQIITSEQQSRSSRIQR